MTDEIRAVRNAQRRQDYQRKKVDKQAVDITPLGLSTRSGLTTADLTPNSGLSTRNTGVCHIIYTMMSCISQPF
jgi:hypothetical protein